MDRPYCPCFSFDRRSAPKTHYLLPFFDLQRASAYRRQASTKGLAAVLKSMHKKGGWTYDFFNARWYESKSEFVTGSKKLHLIGEGMPSMTQVHAIRAKKDYVFARSILATWIMRSMNTRPLLLDMIKRSFGIVIPLPPSPPDVPQNEESALTKSALLTFDPLCYPADFVLDEFLKLIRMPNIEVASVNFVYYLLKYVQRRCTRGRRQGRTVMRVCSFCRSKKVKQRIGR